MVIGYKLTDIPQFLRKTLYGVSLDGLKELRNDLSNMMVWCKPEWVTWMRW
ncbi:hypothetical protein HanIR_Chr10g0490561 [Helianthus annuus]|nr:hypothetical protein HanIR_Chr10g0490561 [Helianthus annuus]